MQTPAGSIRGTVHDADFQAPLALVEVRVVETGQQAETSDLGAYVFEGLVPGQYTLVFKKPGYLEHVRSNVVVAPGRLTDVDVQLAAEFIEMEEFVVQDLQLGAGTEAALLELRFDSPALMDSVSADMMSRAGASDAASALRLVAGASIADDKFAVIRGLPDRYVSSQMNGVRLPSADQDTRAVELDQFPAVVIDSVQVSKTFTPDQQGDASGGAVDVRLKEIPGERVLQLSGQIGLHTQAFGEEGFITYEGGGLDFLGRDVDDRQPQPVGQDWQGAVGVIEDDAPLLDYKLSGAAGNKFVLNDEVTLGLFGSLFYERESTHVDDRTEDELWVESPGAKMTPKYSQGAPSQGTFVTSLFDLEQSAETVQWGGLGTLGLETENHALGLTFLYTHSAQDKATLAEDTRGKEYFFPGYDRNDPDGPGAQASEAAPYLRTETLAYTERTAQTLQLSGRHAFPTDPIEYGDWLTLRSPTLSWYVADSHAGLDQPDKRQFGSAWLAPYTIFPGFVSPGTHVQFKPDATFSYGSLQRTYTTIDEDSIQYSTELEWPFDQWDGEEGYFKLGLFDDQVDRRFDQDSFGNFGDTGASYIAGWNEFWSAVFPTEGGHEITGSTSDVDYEGDQELSAVYSMVDLPLSSTVNLIFGARFESTDISIVNDPEPDAQWFPPGATKEVNLLPGEADADFSRDDVLPSIGIVYELSDELTLRASYAETVARQTFKELTPILQQEFLGGPVFIGNPELGMASLRNYDLRLDYVPYAGGLYSVSWFRKDLEDPIEYVQQVSQSYIYTSPVNYPEGRLSGFELEARQDLGRLRDALTGLSVGANATLIDSEVRLPQSEIDAFKGGNIDAPLRSRDMTNAPEHLYNFYATLDLAEYGTEVGLFYTIQGDTLVTGAGRDDSFFIPSVYAEEFGTLNLSVSKLLGDGLKLKFQAKNLTNPSIDEVYRSKYLPEGDVTKTSYRKGLEFTLSLSASF